MRTAVCKYCGQGRLKWERYPTPSGRHAFRLVDFDTGERHHCPESPHRPEAPAEPIPSGMPAQAIPDGMAEATPAETARPTEPDGARSSVEDALGEWLRRQQVRPELDLDAVKRMVREAIDERVPAPVIIRLPEGREAEIPAAHHLLPELVQAVALRFNVMLVGPAGSGKTTAAQQAAQVSDLAYFEKTMGPATSQWDLVGYLSPDGKYVPGALREPYENGGLLFLDEIDNSNPQTLTPLNGALANGHCQFPDGMVERHPDFVCVAAGNTYGRGADRLYVGRQQLDAATLDRFWVIDWDYDEKAELVWAGSDQVDWTRYVQSARRIARDLKLRVVVSPRASIDGATALRSGIDRDLVASRRLWAGMSAQDAERIRAGMS